MDPDQDQPNASHDDVGSIRWVDDVTSPLGSPTSTSVQLTSSQTSTSSTTSTVSHQRLRNKVTYYEKVWSSGKLAGDGGDETDNAAFSIDVHAFEKRLQEERERKINEQSPRIDVKLRSTPQPSPRPTELPLANVRVNIRHHIETTDSPSDEHRESKRERLDSSEFHEHHQHHARVLTYEKVVTQKSSHKVNITSSTRSHVSSASSPVVRTVEYTEVFGRSPSSERVSTPVDDRSERTRIVRGSTTPTGAVSSHSSSNTSLHGNFTSEGNFSRSQRTPSRERIFERAGSEPHSWSSSAYGSVATTASPVSSVAQGNEFARRHLARERRDSGDSDGASSSDWYQEYSSQSFHTTAPRMDFKRSNSQYDRHIQQIRGTNYSINSFGVDEKLRVRRCCKIQLK